ncbi:MAG TPA: hypothetical protein PK916_08850 [Bacteroidota bacterium]|nr:hypothetical protein [Bacteroidota bacterium]
MEPLEIAALVTAATGLGNALFGPDAPKNISAPPGGNGGSQGLQFQIPQLNATNNAPALLQRMSATIGASGGNPSARTPQRKPRAAVSGMGTGAPGMGVPGGLDIGQLLASLYQQQAG